MGNSLGLISKAAMFGVANEVFNKRLIWQAVNADQEKWFRRYLPVYLDQVLPTFPGNVESVASNQCVVVNAFIERKQMQVRLRDMGPSNLYIASYAKHGFLYEIEGIDVSSEWGNGFETYRLPEKNKVDLHRVDDRPIFVIQGSGGYRVVIARQDYPLLGLAILDDAVEVHSQIATRRFLKDFSGELWMYRYKVDTMPDISYLVNACPLSPEYPIGQAVQQVKWELDRFGFKQEEVSGMSLRKGSPSPFKVDFNFTMSIWYEDLPLPTAVAWVDANDRVRVGNQPETMRPRSITESPEFGE